jgi:histone deacetylase 6
LFPIIESFKPDIILISAGFDSALGDPLGDIGVTPIGYAYMT